MESTDLCIRLVDTVRQKLRVLLVGLEIITTNIYILELIFSCRVMKLIEF
jgi:hypothetical protein